MQHFYRKQKLQKTHTHKKKHMADSLLAFGFLIGFALAFVFIFIITALQCVVLIAS